MFNNIEYVDFPTGEQMNLFYSLTTEIICLFLLLISKSHQDIVVTPF